MTDRPSPPSPHLWIDSFGVAVSLTCAVQCAALPLCLMMVSFPVLVSVVSFAGPALALSGGIEKTLLACAIVLAIASFSLGFRSHRCFRIFLFLVVALALIFFGRLWAHRWYQMLLVISGSLVLAAGHAVNRRLCRSDRSSAVNTSNDEQGMRDESSLPTACETSEGERTI
jgi:hypothetical protein